ncbi:chymotrypsin-C-like [Anoplophora glabripennis]|uniref:chymotrypsin-C-like n=1 Tax=Anoplophora glabripennis TaxID=217634 RepID=UPI0008747A32|nr:chymotrypsin-C-like [Anoplophora glabripennis]
MRRLFITFFLLTRSIIAQNPTPCPEIFLYEPKTPGDRWYGVVRFSLRKNITGIWLRITLDQPADILGNWFGQVTTSDNTVYDIRRPEYILEAGFILSVRFFVKYNLARTIPSLEMIKLNGQTICAVGTTELSSTTPKPQTNKPQIEDFNEHHTIESSTNKPGKPQPRHSVEEVDPDSEFYQGDYNLPPSSPRILSDKSPLRESPNCGTTVPRNTSIPFKDGDTWRGQWPWHAALYRSKGANLVYICGATLITEQHVIAPAHCVTRYHTKDAGQPNSFEVSLGKFYLTRFETDIQNTVVSDIIIHPEYNSLIYINDIAVLKLSKPVKITNFVRPSCLYDRDSDLNSITGKEGTIVGWGIDKNRKLMQVKMTIVPIENCISSEVIPDKIYCAEFMNGISSCILRSVSGMVLSKDGTNYQNTVWQIRGINVFSEIQAPCDEIKHMIFTDVAKYTGWLQGIIKSDSENT